LAEIQEIVQAQGCSFEEAWERWHRKWEEPEPESNVIAVDFAGIRAARC
jgi:hypothetical protein